MLVLVAQFPPFSRRTLFQLHELSFTSPTSRAEGGVAEWSCWKVGEAVDTNELTATLSSDSCNLLQCLTRFYFGVYFCYLIQILQCNSMRCTVPNCFFLLLQQVKINKFKFCICDSQSGFHRSQCCVIRSVPLCGQAVKQRETTGQMWAFP